EVRLDQTIIASVSVHLIGGESAPGVKEGGVLSQPLREIQVEALPLEVPEHIDLDVSHMATGDTLTAPTRAIEAEEAEAAEEAAAEAAEAGEGAEGAEPAGEGEGSSESAA